MIVLETQQFTPTPANGSQKVSLPTCGPTSLMQLEHRLSELAQRYNELSDEYGFTTNLTLQGDYTWPEDRELSESELKIKEFQALTSEIKGLLLSCKDNPRVFDLLYFHLREVAAVVKNRQCVIPQGIFTIDPKDFTPEILFVRNFAAYALAADYINGFQQHKGSPLYSDSNLRQVLQLGNPTDSEGNPMFSEDEVEKMVVFIKDSNDRPALEAYGMVATRYFRAFPHAPDRLVSKYRAMIEYYAAYGVPKERLLELREILLMNKTTP